MWKTILFGCLTLALLTLVQGQVKLVDDCGSSQYFDTTQLQCVACGRSDLIQANDKQSCTCQPQFRDTTTEQLSFQRTCEACAADSYPSRDGTTCLTCASGNYSDALRDCACTAGQYLDETVTAGTKTCVACSNTSIPGGQQFNTRTANGYYECVECKKGQESVDGVCKCLDGYTDANAFCVQTTLITPFLTTYDIRFAEQIRYRSVEIGSRVDTETLPLSSDAINYYYTQGVAGCLVYNDPQFCSLLANLCVLNLGDLDSTVCKLYKEVVQTVPQGETAVRGPILYEEGVKPYDSTIIKTKVSFATNPVTGFVHVMPFFLAKFNLDGSFVSIEELKGQFQFCPHFLDEEEVYKNFGTTYENNCEIDLNDFLSSDPDFFYELYLRDSDNELVSIPVVIDNLHAADGTKPNESSDESKWVMLRRFYLYDRVGGVTGAETGTFLNTTPKFLRYAKNISLKIELKMNNDAEINLPMLFIEYRSRKEGSLGTADVEFLVEYTMDLDNFWTAVMIIFIVLTIYSAGYSFLKIYVFIKAHPRDYVELFSEYSKVVIANTVMIILKTWAHLMFWFMWAISAYWFITFKLQTEAFILLPPQNTMEESYLPFQVLFGFTLGIYFFNLIKMIIDQSSASIFFVDWEPAQKVLVRGSLVDKVSVWRTLFVANEFDELQTWRYVNLETSLFLLIFILTGLKWENLAYSQTAMDTDQLSSPLNSVLLFFLSTFFYLLITLPQIVFPQLLARWLPTKLNTLNDLCQVANISVFILDTPFHGYFIEGISEAGQAEGDAEDLRLALDGITNHPRPTGLAGGDPNVLKSFEMYPSKDLVEMLTRMYNGEDIIPQRVPEEMEQFGVRESKKGSDDLRKDMNKALKDHFKRVTTSGASVQEKQLWQRWIGFPPSASSSSLSNTSIFYKDNWNSYQNIFFCGKDYQLVLFDILFFNLFYLYVGNSVVAAIATYVMVFLYTFFRGSRGEDNLARRTMIDKRFLI
eukprot:CAMPEP_0114976316 /NCGR_PEP_ID=MMETSP0216-20121206/2601_1 /TAXON_ID=223996 /ORGANISM="Protocruzia adherens, Strain Boccale" /LENGTH=982 /DNA_ID=CAMNT_0002337223 /DNA_START=160 /DNA_END=3108 /DNA_ORIENTATION=-